MQLQIRRLHGLAVLAFPLWGCTLLVGEERVGIPRSTGVDLAERENPGQEDDLGEPAPTADAGDEHLDGGSPKGDAATSPGSCGNITGTRAEQVCLRWNCDRQDLDEGTWSGSIATCTPGDISANARTNALRILNLYRFLAELPEVVDDSVRNAAAQACALIMDANNTLSHHPPTSWSCYQQLGDDTAGRSNLNLGPGVRSVDTYMNDFGNNTTMGHRRWILSNSLGPVGLGSTPSASCMQVIGGSGNAKKSWVAWPAAGPFPAEALKVGGFGRTLDDTGWTIQSDTIDISSAAVSISDGTQTLPVTRTGLYSNYGSRYALRWRPNGWSAQAGKSYQVTVTPGSGPAINYTVDVLACP